MTEEITNGAVSDVPDDESFLKRDKTIIKTSIIGITANVFLAGFKAVFGLLTHSIAIVLDAVNNLSDVASSVITIVGTKLASKEPDKKHPFGHGRVEYISAMMISIIILYAGITSLVESVKKIITPVVPDYSTASLVMVSVAVIVKIILGKYVKNVGKKVNSDALVNSGEDATLDAVISASTLVAALIFILSGLSLEAWLAAVISVIILKSGYEMIRDTMSKILGESTDTELARNIESTIMTFPNVSGAYDLVLNNYGPDRFLGSIHIEVPDTYSASAIDELIREITIKVAMKHNVILTAVGVYSLNTSNDEVKKMRDNIYDIALSHKYVTQTHGFFVNEEKKTIRFDAVISFDAPNRQSVYEDVCRDISEKYPDYTLQITMDSDFSEE